MGTDGADQPQDNAESEGEGDLDDKPSDQQFLQMVSEAESQASMYSNQVNRKSWARVYRAFHQEHFNGSKYSSADYKNRSKIFVPKTRTAVRKDLAAVAASLFGTIDAVTLLPGNEGDAQQRASAEVLQEVVNYRTDRTSGKASIPWFHVALGARQTSVLTGVCLSKQSWKLEMQRSGTEKVTDDETGEERLRDIWKPFIDRPNSELIPPENFVIDPAANWTNPAQDAAYLIIKWPMRIDEIRKKQKDPRQPWKALPESILRGSPAKAKFDQAAIRRSREQGLDRFDEASSGKNFEVIWVYETYMRTAGDDWTFLSVGDKHMLTEPKPVREVYPEQFGERPLVMGYGSFEAFRLFPMSSAESWQMLQQETNDIRNLTLDAVKQSVLPVTKVVRGRQVDLDSLKRRAQGTSIMVTSKDDVTWDRPPDVSASVRDMTQKLDIDFDDAAGQQNYGTVDANNNLGKTLGGLKLAAGAANAVQEFDIRIWIETWCEPALAQIVRLIQFYESDPIVLGLAGEKAQLMQKYGISQISNELLENSVTLRVNIGLGSGDPQQRLSKFESATNIALPLLEKTQEFQSGSMSIDPIAVMDEVYGSAGYRDGGKRFIKKGQPQQNPMQQPQLDSLLAKTAKDKAAAKALILNALANAAKVGLGQKELEDAFVNSQFQNHLKHVDQVGRATEMGHKHGMAIRGANQPQVGPDGQPMPDSGPGVATGTGSAVGDAPALPSGGDLANGVIPGATDVGAGNDGLTNAEVGSHGVPAGDAGQQQLADAASEQANLEKATKPRGRRLVHHRGTDGRITHSDVYDL